MHFRREKYIPRGGPDGGDGGRGGDIRIQVSAALNTLHEFQHQHRFIADDGKRGAKQNQTGHSADDLVILVPPGTIIYNADNHELVADLVNDDQEITLCKGGRGGRGNSRFANSHDQALELLRKGHPVKNGDSAWS